MLQSVTSSLSQAKADLLQLESLGDIMSGNGVAGAEQQSSEAGSNGTANSGNSTSSTVAGTKVSIVEEASEMGDQAYDPNPVNVKVGDTVTWTNIDNMEHTVTSGTGPSDRSKGKQFDSGLSGPTVLTAGKTFSHLFTKAGVLPYFCQIHPTLVGKVVVS